MSNNTDYCCLRVRVGAVDIYFWKCLGVECVRVVCEHGVSGKWHGGRVYATLLHATCEGKVWEATIGGQVVLGVRRRRFFESGRFVVVVVDALTEGYWRIV